MGGFESVRLDNFGAYPVSNDTTHQTPENEYTRRLGDRQQQLADVRALHRRLWTYLIINALAGIAIACSTLSSHSISTLWILLPSVLVLFIFRSLTNNVCNYSRVQRIANFYELGIARLRHQWQGQGIGGEEFRPDKHPYATDLDLFGAGSLFELLCTARTGIGRATLANWLLNAAECREATERQEAIGELRARLGLQEDWASLGGQALAQVNSSAVRDWAGAPSVDFPLYVRVFAILLPICLITLSILAYVGLFGHYWLLAIAFPIGLEACLAAWFLKKTRLIAANLVLPSSELALLVPLLARLEAEPFRCPWLRSLQSQLATASNRPSEQIRILRLWVWLLDLRRSEHFALTASMVLWGTNLAILIERWRQRNREALARWLDSLGQFEALLSLARYSYENPEHTFATLKPQSSPLFQAEGLAHPLLDGKTCTRCDLSLDAEGTQLIMVSGSNMSGKSTLLRSVGVNAVLAFAGAPVGAARLLISPLQIGCSIVVQDSFSQAKSRFQAEIERLKWILTLSRSKSSLFLLDELLGGTNSNDRFFGARAVIEQLTGTGAVGVVTTHDLALTEVVKALPDRAINVHFEEQYEGGEMRFDYRMRPGTLGRTNGLNVMAALGVLPMSKASDPDVTTPNQDQLNSPS
jgi:MutS domain V